MSLYCQLDGCTVTVDKADAIEITSAAVFFRELHVTV